MMTVFNITLAVTEIKDRQSVTVTAFYVTLTVADTGFVTLAVTGWSY